MSVIGIEEILIEDTVNTMLSEIEGFVTVWNDLTKADVVDQFADMML